MNRYPLWKNILVSIVLFVGLIYALPNIFDQDPALEISGSRRAEADAATEARVREALDKAGIAIKSLDAGSNKLLLRFDDSESQLRAKDSLETVLGGDYTLALTLSSDVPGWLRSVGALPMYLGLDLRGGIHVLIDVDMDAAVEQALDRYSGDIRTLLRDEKLRYTTLSLQGDAVIINFKEAEVRAEAINKIEDEFRNLLLEPVDSDGAFQLQARMSKNEQQTTRKFALDQNITTLRNRVNALGVSEPLIQQQGERRIVVQLPGAQDPARLKDLLGATATLEYRLEDTEHSVEDAVAGRVPVGSKLYRTREGRPILLKKRVIVTGNQITDASSGFDQRSNQPAVFVSLDGPGARRMRNVTTENVGKPMAVVFIETRTESKIVDGKKVTRKIPVQEVISVANILEPFGRRFQTTGLDSPAEAHDLALLLRAGALAAPIEIVEERTIGPSLGQDNIDQGFRSVIIGMLLVMVFMAVSYRVFGMVANMALLLNLVLIVAVLSMLQATLTLPGIAGIVLTVGMAVDANVLIFERIREEIGIGNTPQASIHAGYEKALSTIVDANVTTLIAAVVLFSFGTGPIKGFAITLFIGILTSMFTAIVGTRAVINLVYGGRRLEKLVI
ncbi:MAG: protein translocase subunit SecD [Chromatiaceae bacterium]|nr:protein translocase subunit SecD [Gammaproteobacteria bacterium]MCB1872350.1 protein translocase subunit SecD [Gammaproteobacteria bacterium]MCB1880474.1 protein translocase subunit SecD [Gammaproteobacteria bacterium]MCP5448034.1 protein translocase subunit SecD [Chromatiaceae bacterium]